MGRVLLGAVPGKKDTVPPLPVLTVMVQERRMAAERRHVRHVMEVVSSLIPHRASLE